MSMRYPGVLTHQDYNIFNMERIMVVFRTDIELVNLLLKHKPQGPCTVQSTVIPAHTKKSRTTGEPFEALFPGGMFRTKVEYVWIGNTPSSNHRSWGTRISPLMVRKDNTFYLSYRTTNPNYKRSDIIWHTASGAILPKYLVSRFVKEFWNHNNDVFRTPKMVSVVAFKAASLFFVRAGYTADFC